MGDAFNILFSFLRFVFDSVVKEAATEEGAARLKKFLDELEAAGVDVPFYEPSEQPQPSEGTTDAAAIAARAREQRKAEREAKRQGRAVQ